MPTRAGFFVRPPSAHGTFRLSWSSGDLCVYDIKLISAPARWSPIGCCRGDYAPTVAAGDCIGEEVVVEVGERGCRWVCVYDIKLISASVRWSRVGHRRRRNGVVGAIHRRGDVREVREGGGRGAARGVGVGWEARRREPVHAVS